MKWIIGILILTLILIAGCSQEQADNNNQEVVDNEPTQQMPEGENNVPEMIVEETQEMTEPEGVTKAELSMHDSEDDCWIAYDGQVFDITDWLPRHPGSAGAIIPYCGTSEDFASAFNGQHGTKQENRLFKEGELMGDLI